MFYLTKHEDCSYFINMSFAHILTRFALERLVMTPNLLTAPNTGSASVSVRSCSLLQYGYLGFRFMRYQWFPWLRLAIALLKLPFTSGVERIREQVRYCNAIARIDFVSVYGLLNDLLW